jgi:hypothetical protein
MYQILQHNNHVHPELLQSAANEEVDRYAMHFISYCGSRNNSCLYVAVSHHAPPFSDMVRKLDTANQLMECNRA